MPRTKQEYFIVTFPSTHAAIAAEQRAEELGLEGRLIPTPRELTAGCGLSFAAEPAQADALLEAFESGGIAYEEYCRLEL